MAASDITVSGQSFISKTTFELRSDAVCKQSIAATSATSSYLLRRSLCLLAISNNAGHRMLENSYDMFRRQAHSWRCLIMSILHLDAITPCKTEASCCICTAHCGSRSSCVAPITDAVPDACMHGSGTKSCICMTYILYLPQPNMQAQRKTCMEQHWGGGDRHVSRCPMH